MTGKLGLFYVEQSGFGCRLIAKSLSLTPDCLGPDEVATNIEALKNDLDACEAEMNRLNATRPSSAFDESGNA